MNDMTTEKCSICGKNYPKNTIYSLAINVGFVGQSIGYICQDCVDKIYPEHIHSELRFDCECDNNE